jgi:hypothetical protein
MNREKWYKFYVMEFKNKFYDVPSDKVFLKFGYTHHMDVMKRFDPDVDDGYPKNYKEWNIKPLFSIVCKSKSVAEQYEKHFLEEVFPYNSNYKVWVEDLFGLANKNYYSDNSGVTELRLVSLEEKNKVLKSLFETKKRSV